MTDQPDASFDEWRAADAAGRIRVPREDDDKYSRGVLGVMTGSAAYPGAAVLGVDAAVRTGVGMARYLGPGRATRLVLQRRPEVVTAAGRVQAWLLGSGMASDDRPTRVTGALRECLDQRLPTVLDAGALDLVEHASGFTVVTPHAGELARMWARVGEEVHRASIAHAPESWAIRTADRFGVTVLLKGARTVLASPGGTGLQVTASASWAATAGSGDVLGGILGALLATNAAAATDSERALREVAATAAYVHAAAGARASGGGPIAALDIADAVPGTIARLLRRDGEREVDRS